MEDWLQIMRAALNAGLAAYAGGTGFCSLFGLHIEVVGGIGQIFVSVPNGRLVARPSGGGNVVGRMAASAELRWVFLGGTVGTALRHGVHLISGSGESVWLTMVLNIIGALLLGMLVGFLAKDHVVVNVEQRRLQLLLGTGLLGGFTTYSALAVDSARFIHDGQVGLLLAYALGTLVLGAVASWVGLLLGRRIQKVELAR